MQQPKKLIVMVFGTFDILHPGHLDFFRQAKKFGDCLIVVIARDHNVEKIKNKKPKFSEQDRLKIVDSLKIVDQAVLGDKQNWFKVILKFKPAVICLGYDQTVPSNFFDELQNRGIEAEIVRLKAYKPQNYKSSFFLNS